MIGFIIFILFMGIVGVLGVVGYNYIKKTMQTDDEKEDFIPTTQDNLPIDWVRKGIVKMKNGTYAIVINLPSINIDLMEANEREVVFSQYRSILTAIDFPFQFLQQSRVVDIDEYMKKLEKIQKGTENEFVRLQLEHYKRYMNGLVNSRAILTRKFYLIIPFDELQEKKSKANQSGSVFDLSFKKKQKEAEKTEKETVIEEEKKFEVAYKHLTGRADIVMRSFSRFDIKPTLLNDEKLTELFYTSYNKNKSVYQPLRASELKDREYYNLYVKRGDTNEV
ncbi:hypothetical protein [Bacillus thuringiensis]|uniref:hypothetical protein n=1 Tax=Bacillus thuringiensis TaxID=1428 RepID=UPI0021D66B98|nr:hypothetical protein [Bacillus thuringiensis]MCU7666970.1 hypothetical protein [Bacillus thuringiensis]